MYVENKVWLISTGGVSASYPPTSNYMHQLHVPTPQSARYWRGTRYVYFICTCVLGYPKHKDIHIFGSIAGGSSQFRYPQPVQPHAPYHQFPQSYNQPRFMAPHMYMQGI